MRSRDTRRQQIMLRSWLILTGFTISIMMGFSAWLLATGAEEKSQAWLGWSVLVMLLSVYVSDVIRGVRRIPEGATVPCCECCERRTNIHLPPPPQPGDPPNLTKI